MSANHHTAERLCALLECGSNLKCKLYHLKNLLGSAASVQSNGSSNGAVSDIHKAAQLYLYGSSKLQPALLKRFPEHPRYRLFTDHESAM